jgi:hypothetical protein
MKMKFGLEASANRNAYACTPLQEATTSLESKRAGDCVLQAVLELSANVQRQAFVAAWEKASQLTIPQTRIAKHN